MVAAKNSSDVSGIKTLVKRLSEIKNPNSEAETESKLIDPLLKILGWDTETDEVVKKESLGPNFPDYTIKIADRRKFILEAKAVGVSLDGKYSTKTFVEQALDYAKRSDCTWAVLTNFKELRLYTTDKKIEDSLVFAIRSDEFEGEGFQRLWQLSRQSIAKGELDKWGENYGFKKKRIQIDKILLKDLLDFREQLSKNLLLNNEELRANINLADEIVQKFLDRLIFIRNCEDRGLETEKLITYAGTKNILKRLREAFMDNRRYGYYNSALFAKHELDNNDLSISDEVIAHVIQGLYESKGGIKYDFSVIESDILGSIYEQYLSHLLNKRKKGGLGENLGKKKHHGIYYTPAYVVDYIVKHTLGVALKDRQESKIKDLKVLDMACGSGSFLIKCYDIFEQAYLGNLRVDEPPTTNKSQLAISVSAEKSNKLKPLKKCEIIEKNIHGVDLDKQAVEIAQLNLLLKIEEKIKLPFTNIVVGDSLLDENNSDFNIGLFEQFESVRKNEFDVIIGNPPYVDVKELDPKIVKKLFNSYQTVENRMNLYSVFIERALQILKPGGYFGFIIPNSILYNDSYSKIRKQLLNSVSLKEIIRMPDNVFEGVTVETIILIFKKENPKGNSCKVTIYNADDNIDHVGKDNCLSVASFNQAEWIKEGIINLTLHKGTRSILKQIEKDTQPFDFYCDFCLGLTPYDKYKGHSKEDIENRVFHSDKAKTKFHKPLLSGEDITRYGVHWSGESYIKYGSWLGAPREPKFFIKPRILIRQIISGKPGRIFAGYTTKELYNSQVAFNILVKDVFKKDVGIKYLLALVNSNLLSYYHREKYLDPTKTTFQKILILNAKKLPIKIGSKAAQDRIENLVDTIVGLNDQLYKAKDSSKLSLLEKQIAVIDKKINEEVYKIYGIEGDDQATIDSVFG